MAESLLPPLVLVLRARASELISEMKLADAEVKKTAASTEASATKIEGAAAKSAAATEEGAVKQSGAWGRVTGVGKAAAIGLAGAAIAVGVSSLKMAGDFQTQVSRLHTAAGESEGNLKMVGNGILQIARDTGTSTTEITSGMYQVESSGFHGADGLKVMQAAAEGAKNEGADLGGVANALTTVMTDLGAKSGQSATLMSQMVAAVGQGKMKMDDLAGSIHSVLPNAAALGISFPQVAGALATMTAEGVSADQAAQNLNHTIVKLAAPTTAMANNMAAYGVNANDLKNNLGKNGLTGTMDILSQAILSHMGPAGLALQDTFNKSKVAGADVRKMLTSLPSGLQSAAKGFLDGSVSAKDFTKDIKAQGAAGSAQGAQFMALAKTANGFSDALKSGKSDAQTYSQAMYSMLGDQTGLQVALHLTGDHLQTFKDNVNIVGKATADSNGHVKDWSATQGLFNTQMGRFQQTIVTTAIAIGQKLLPPVTAFVKFLTDHPAVMIAFAGVITGVLVVAAAAWAAQMAKTVAGNIAEFAKMIAKGAVWVAETAVQILDVTAEWAIYAAEGIGRAVVAAATGFASMVAAGAAWVAQAAVQTAQAIASGAVWIAEHVAMAAVAVVQYGAIALAATAAFVAENAATLGIIAVIAVLVAAIVYAATHWKQVWGAISDAAKWAYDSVLKPVGQAIVDYVIHPIVAAVQWYLGIWVAVWHGVASAATWAYNNVIRPIGSGISAVFHGIQAALSWLSGVWSSLWNGIGSALRSIYNSTIGPIVNTIKGAIGGVMSAVNGVGSVASSVGHFLGFANGGVVPGAPGEPRLAVVHGGEYVLSQDMQAGRQAVDPGILSNAKNANGYTASSGQSATERALTGGSPTPTATGTGGAPVVNVYAQTNASASRIGAELGWVLRKTA